MPPVIIKLKDQFGASETPLRFPLYFAVPVTKRHDSKDFPIRKTRSWLRV